MLAKWLATTPRLLILDWPTVGVDVGARDGIYKIVRELAEAGMAILMISDEVPEVYFNADRILHMASGRIVAEYDPRRISIAAIWSAPSMRDYWRTPRGGAAVRCPAALMLFLGVASPTFFTPPNFASLLNTTPVNIIWAVGLLVVLIAGGIDISFAVAASVVAIPDGA